MSKKQEKPTEEAAPSLQFINLDQIVSSPLNPRKTFDQAELEELASSIGKLGVIQAITVRPVKKGYEVVCGDRRLRAATLAGLEVIPASVRNLTDQEAMELMVTENLQRKDVAPLEEAEAFEYMRGRMTYSLADIAARIGKNESYVTRRLQLLKLIPELQESFRKDVFGIGHAELLCRIPDEDQRLWIKNSLNSWSGPGSIKDLRRYLNSNVEHMLAKATFDTTIKLAGVIPCTQCPANSAFNNTLFPDRAEEAICHNSMCFKNKTDAAFSSELDTALADPKILLVSGYSYNGDKVVEKLKKDGHTILKEYDDYQDSNDWVDKPEMPDLSEYDIEDYDSEEEMKESFATEMKEYESELNEYNIALAKFNAGATKAKKAFIVSGSDRGTYKYIELKSQKGNAAGAAHDPEEAIKAQRANIQQKLTRGRELDNEKVMAKLIDHCKKLPLLESFEVPSFDSDMNALVLLAYDSLGYSQFTKDIHEKIGLPRDFYAYSNGGQKLYDAIANASPEVKALIIRRALFNKYGNVSHAGTSWAVLTTAAKDWCPEEFNTYMLQQEEIRARREAKLNKQLEDLKNEDPEKPKSNNKKSVQPSELEA